MKIGYSFDIVCINCEEICEPLWEKDAYNWLRMTCKCGRTNIELRGD